MRIFFDLFHKSPSIFNSHRLICIRECDFVHTSIKHSFTLDKYIPKEIYLYVYVLRKYRERVRVCTLANILCILYLHRRMDREHI